MADFQSHPIAVPVLPTPTLEASAIAKFRPTPKEIIGRIAPHVLEEHGMKRRRSRSPSRPPQVYAERKCNPGGGGGGGSTVKKEPSPLRFSAVISREGERDHSRIYFGAFDR